MGALMGRGWQRMVALLTSFIRQENTIATLGVPWGGGPGGVGTSATCGAARTPGAALAFFAVQMLVILYAATVTSIHQGTKPWHWTGFGVLLLLSISLAVGIAIYQGAVLLGVGA